MTDTDQEIGQVNGKSCTKCKQWKPFSDFQKDAAHKTGYRSQCRECVKIYKKAYRIEYAESIKEYSKKKYEENPQKSNDANKAWREANPDKESSRKKRWRELNPDFHKEWQAANPDKVKEYQDRYYEKNREFRNESGRMWRKNNPEKQKEITRVANQKKLSTPKGKIESAIRNGIYNGIVRGSKAGRKTLDLLDFTIDDLKSHLERQFQPGMSWDNYGKGGWHIDHIIPLSAHNYETPDDIDFKRAWALSNLQPLWEAENLSKSNKLLAPFQPSLHLSIKEDQNVS